MQKLISVLILTIFSIASCIAQSPTIIYLIPGQGSDYRIFNNIEIEGNYEIHHIKYFTPKEGTSMHEFAQQLSVQIDTSEKFIVIGVSLGGMIATEMTGFLNPEKIIIISSAKCKYELPYRYRFQSKVPAYKIISGNMSKKGAFVMQPIVEPDRNKEKDIFISMLKDKDPDFLKRTIAMIMTWEREEYSQNIVHIHGDNDKTIPIRNVKCNYKVVGGSHMMALTIGKRISDIITKILEE